MLSFMQPFINFFCFVGKKVMFKSRVAPADQSCALRATGRVHNPIIREFPRVWTSFYTPFSDIFKVTLTDFSRCA